MISGEAVDGTGDISEKVLNHSTVYPKMHLGKRTAASFVILAMCARLFRPRLQMRRDGAIVCSRMACRTADDAYT